MHVHTVIPRLCQLCLLQNDCRMTSVDENRNCGKDEGCIRLTVVICCKKAIVKVTVGRLHVFDGNENLSKTKVVMSPVHVFHTCICHSDWKKFFSFPICNYYLPFTQLTSNGKVRWLSWCTGLCHSKTKKDKALPPESGFSVFFFFSFALSVFCSRWWTGEQMVYAHNGTVMSYLACK